LRPRSRASDPSDSAAETALRCARAAHPEDSTQPGPAVYRTHILRARESPAYAAALGAACKAFDRLYRGLTSEASVIARVDERPQGRVLLITWTVPDLVRALRREGPVVLLDASAGLLVEPVKNVVGYEPRVVRLALEDAAPVRRTVLRCSSANRTGWFAHGRPVWPLLVGPLRAALDWALEDPDTHHLGLITYQVVELALRATLDPTAEAPRRAWRDLGHSARQLDAAARELAPVLARWTREPLQLAHYGGIRGLNAWQELDGLITLGDPWSNLGEVAHETAYLGLPDSSARALARCQAELEQAQERLRTTSRSRPARALHVGVVLPGSSGWLHGDVEVRPLDPGRPRGAAAMTPDELVKAVDLVGGVKAMARELKVAPVTVRRYMSGERPRHPAGCTGSACSGLRHEGGHRGDRNPFSPGGPSGGTETPY
jgi:hypothetical protein